MIKSIQKSILLCLVVFLSHLSLCFSDQLSLSFNEKYSHLAQESGNCNFIPPKDWQTVNKKELPDKVITLVKGEGKYELPPSLNLAIEHVGMSLKQYIETVRDVHLSHGNTTWKKLGTLQTNAGPATLTQLERTSGWGKMRMIQAILMRNNTAYILTATALANEFPKFYKEFFQAIQSLTISEEIFPGLSNERLQRLQNTYSAISKNWEKERQKKESAFDELSSKEIFEKTFESEDFKEISWAPFLMMLEDDFSDMGGHWKKTVANKVKDNLKTLL